MNFRLPIALGTAVTAAAIAFTAVPAQAQNAQVGNLTCDVSGGIGMIITSRKEVACTFTNSRGEPELYTGVIRKFGLDIGATSSGTLVWNVFAPSGRWTRGALSGNYGGASGEASIVAGLGANVLIGGSRRSIALQPVSVQGQSGLNIAVGVADLRLRAVEPAPGRRY